MKFHLNEKVAFLKEKGYAIVKSVSNSQIIVEDDHGFERQVQAIELVKIITEDFQVDSNFVKLEEEPNYRTAKKKQDLNQKKKQSNYIDKWEIDLHIEKLPIEIINTPSLHYIEMQMKALRYFLEKVKINRVKRFVVIHGVGDGILKDEVRSYLSKFDIYKLNEADKSKYGNGATQVIVSGY